jgi:hypothetical protein
VTGTAGISHHTWPRVPAFLKEGWEGSITEFSTYHRPVIDLKTPYPLSLESTKILCHLSVQGSSGSTAWGVRWPGLQSQPCLVLTYTSVPPCPHVRIQRGECGATSQRGEEAWMG